MFSLKDDMGVIMKKRICSLLLILICFLLTLPSYAKEGDCGYEGGISSGQNLLNSKTSSEYEYQEVVFISGKPIVMKGKVTVKKKTTNDSETNTYTFNISDTNDNSLKRTISLQSKITKKDNNQVVKETSIYGKPSETVTIEGKTYTLDKYSLTKSSIVDVKPAVDYYAGNMESKKTYKLRDSDDVSITVTVKGEFYGYNQNWSNGEVQLLDYFIQNESSSSNWSGTAKVKLSSVSTTQFKYVKNYPEEISFDGGYVQSQNITSKLIYQTSMPEFDKDGLPTDRIVNKKGNLKIDAFPNEKRLIVFDLPDIRGHWAEEDIKKLYSLEIYDDNPSIFIPNQYMSRGEFAKALGKAINISLPQTTSSKKSTTKIVSPYTDVQTNNPLFPYIQQLTAKNAMNGYGDGKFYPDETITRVQAISTFVRILGLEGMAKDEYPVTVFKDNDYIPSWALRSIYAANKIGFVKGDNGYLNPNQYLTKAEAAALLNRFIDYMRKDMAKGYSDKILNY